MEPLDAFIADHDGIITTAQARRCGLSRDQIRHRITSGHWQAVGRGVYLCADHHLTEAARFRAAVALHHGVADRTSAAWWHGMLDELPPAITVSVPRTAHGARSSALLTDVVRRSYPAEDVEVIRDVPVTRRPLTVLAAAAEVADGIGLFDRQLQIGAVTVPALHRAAERNSGMHGLQVGRELLAVLDGGSQSVAERHWVTLLREHGITGWVQQLRFGRWVLDFAWPDHRVAVEIQGWQWHNRHERMAADQAKAAALAAAGWLILPFSWSKIRYQPEQAVAELCSALATRS